MFWSIQSSIQALYSMYHTKSNTFDEEKLKRKKYFARLKLANKKSGLTREQLKRRKQLIDLNKALYG